MNFFTARPSAILVLFGLSFASASSEGASTLELNSVSVLFPPPTRTTLALYPSVGNPAFFSPTLTRATAVDSLSEIDAEGALTNAVMVAIRIDPCFRNVPSDACEHQVRAIWQSPKKLATANGAGATSFIDGGLHTFYRLDDASWSAFLAEWRAIWEQHATSLHGKALGVNPVLVSEGVREPTFARLRNLIDRTLPSRAITRIAYTVLYFRYLGQFEAGWKFSIFDVVGGVPEVSSSPSIPGFRPLLAYENLGDDRTFDARDTVSGGNDTADTDRIFRYLRMSENPEHLASSVESERLFRSMLRLQNPGMHAPGTTDCLSCHSAAAAERTFGPKLTADTRARVAAMDGGQAYANPRHNLSPTTEPATAVTRNFRMFGYFRSEPSVNPRVIHESAVVADRLAGAVVPH